ncbi:hypothetical protein DWQ98_09645 [Staphylococcus aureus]|uniref:hypothetical protein n=1 Tax=Staphylococcus aureus TaxID=1280 RepID=UPI000E0E8E42|nr:hypothetical protein [Staphylococcus aureus]RDK20926.1 hypothetical protein DWQ95_09985 [Staphylococcus aureus]RDK21974.1 hypothetical protein DWQ73_09640 [Staphylococcus aureus]RDK27590.1 hypothetical protein DWQ82_06165 [Staphylococcus aureus]RDK28490.1 hypothetical protein DWQ98_09645 [Staphylococcus aureus]RDK32683.1 hypothetical protein DWQ84_05570 [Staphylococcus aureus]
MQEKQEYMNDADWRIYGLKSEYERVFETARENYTQKTLDIHDKLLEELKKEELTYREAYAVLQLVYLTLKHESEFVNLHQ